MTGAIAFQKATTSGEINQCARQDFLSLYSNRAYHIYKAPGDPNWKVSRFRLATGLIDAAISAECDTFYGAFWGDETQFAVLDIDKDSKYHNAQELQRLRDNLAAVGLPGSVPFQSSHSTGWHLYVPFFDPAPSKEVEQALKAWLKSNGYDIRCGQLEVFPSGNGLRLPLQRGFAWLDDNGSVTQTREKTTLDAAVSRFLFDLNSNSNNWAIAKTQIESQLAASAAAAGGDAQERRKRLELGGFDDLFSGGKITEHWEKGRNFWQEGLSSAGQRHDAVLFIGHYLWYGDSENGIAPLPGARNDEYRAKLIEDWLIDKHNGFCRHIDQNKWETIRAQIKRAVLWRGDGQAKEYEPYRLTDRLLKRLLAIYRKTGKVWTVDDFKQANEDRRDEARCKIRAAVDQCLNEGRQISRSTLAAITGCSPNTLKKHADLWKLFAIGSGEYNRGGGGGSVLSCGSCPGSEKQVLRLFDQADSGDLSCVQESCSVELAPIVLTPPFLLPGSEPTSEPPASRPSPSGSFGSLDAGSLVRRYSGRVADGAGGLEPNCNKLPVRREILPNLTGLMAVTTCHLPVNLLVHVSVNKPLGAVFRLFLHQAYTSNKSCKHPSGVSFRRIRSDETYTSFGGCIRVNILQGHLLRFLVYSNVRGPPCVNSALLAAFAF